MTYIFHNIFPLSPQQLPVHSFSSQDTDALLSAIRQTTAPHLGISLQLSVDGRVKAIAFATPNEAFYVTLQGSVRGDIATNADKRALKVKAGSTTALSPRIPDLTTMITTKSDKTLAGFSMARIALHIHRDKRWHVNGVDLSSLLVSTSERPLYPSDFIQKKVSSDVNRRQVNALWYPDAASVDDDDDDDDEGDEAMRRVCLRAWISAVCADADPSAMQFAKHVNTRRASIRADHFVCLENMMLCAELLENQKPIRIENEFTAIMSDSDGLLLENARFTTRVRRSNQTSVEFHTNDGRSIIGQAISAEGKTTKIQLTQGQYRSDIKRVVVHGREELTCSENAREEFVLLILQGDIKLTNQLFINLVWFPSGNSARAERPRQPPTTAAFMKLNESQKEVAAAMISPSHPIVIAHGPPGTGKTSTIAAATDYWITQGESAWIIAQSNVGVKNIARSFVDKGITDFKIIVSKEFYVEWHEHLYVEIQENLIRADDLSQFKDAYETERSLLGSRIILCTLSTLSNPVLNSCHMFKNMPVEKLVVDEASQINVFEYMHLFHKFEDLEKVCFFGDPKQLPPFGQDAVPQLQSIFDVKHLKPTAYFLNTQYRMPIPLGEFISREVYNSKLKSHHKTHSPSSVAFIDVGKGVEASAGKSWTNVEEARIVVHLVRSYYLHKDYCIITPYDAQRAKIVKELEAAGLPSDKVFNVDSFQGHEAEYVIVSATRTTRPGFLSVRSRTNVMLTRCKAGMIIVTNAYFASYCAERTLLGKLTAHWGDLQPHGSLWIDWRKIVEGSVDLPGAPAPRPRLPTSLSLQSHLSWNVSKAMAGVSTSQSAPQRHSNRVPPAGKTKLSGAPSNPPTQLLEQQMSRLHVGSWPNSRFHRADDPHFPEIPNSDPPAKSPALQGSWRRGSKSVK